MDCSILEYDWSSLNYRDFEGMKIEGGDLSYFSHPFVICSDGWEPLMDFKVWNYNEKLFRF